ncbi:MAG: hypothetical protein WDM86_06555 [Rhizomicrobium sp.]
MRRDQHVLAHRAGGQHLLPFRNRDRLAHAADHGHHDRRAQEAVALQIETFLPRRLGFEQARRQEFTHAAAGFALEHDEAPGEQLAVIRHPRGGGQDRFELLGRRPRSRHGLGRAGTARQQQVDGIGGGTVEGGRCGIHIGPMRGQGVGGVRQHPILGQEGSGASLEGTFAHLTRSFVTNPRRLL